MNASRSLRAALGLSAAACLGLATWTACGGAGSTPRSDLMVLYTATVDGYIEPCGCVAGQIGGIDRLAAYVQEEKAAHPNAIFVDGGDLFCGTTVPDPALAEQLPLKARAFFRVWKELGCRAMALGEHDLVLGVEPLRELSREFDIPILCGNLDDAEGEPVFPASVRVDVGGKRIGIFSLLGSPLNTADPKHPVPVDVRALCEEEGLTLVPWRERSQEIVDDLARDCDLILCMSHMGFGRNNAIAARHPEIDAVFGGHFGQSNDETNFVGDTPVLVSFVKGSRVGRMEWWFGDPDDYFREGGHGPIEDVSSHVAVPVRIESEEFSLVDLEGREAAFGTEAWEQKVANRRANLAEAREALEKLGPWPDGNAFSHVLVPMTARVARSELALDSVDRYHRELHAYWTDRIPDRPIGTEAFPGPEGCVACHPVQVEFWKATRHARAFATLRATQQEVDAECIGCHTVGYREPGGFAFPHGYRGHENVQCAACHGPAGDHVAGGDSWVRSLPIRTSLETCARCHDAEHDPRFAQDGAAKFPLVACPPMEPMGLGTPELLAGYREAGHALATSLDPRWGRAAYAYRRGGELDTALALAERWYGEQPRNPDAGVTYGELLLEHGRRSEALEVFDELLEERPALQPAWLGTAQALLSTDPEAALVAAREAFSLAPAASPAVRVLVEAHLAQNRRIEARDALAAYLEAQPASWDEVSDLALKLGLREVASGP